MHELVSQLFDHLWSVWRFRWTGLIVAWCIALGGWIWVAQLPDQYEATARIHVDSNSVLRPLLRGLAIQPDVTQRVALMSKTLLSRPNLEKLMRMTDMDLQAKTPADKERLLDGLKKDVKLSGNRRNESLYSISFIHHDRQTAKAIVQALITVFIESAMGEERKESSDAHEFLDQQIADYEQRLIEAENRLAAFKQKHAGIMPGAGGGFYQKLESARSQLSTARLQLREAQNRRKELKRQLEGEEPVFLSGGMDRPSATVSSSFDGRIQKLETKLDNLLSRYTELHPEVVQIKALLADLEAEKEREIEEIRAAQADTPQLDLNNNPVYQQMRSMLAETEARVAELRVRFDEYSTTVKDLESKIDRHGFTEDDPDRLGALLRDPDRRRGGSRGRRRHHRRGLSGLAAGRHPLRAGAVRVRAGGRRRHSRIRRGGYRDVEG